MREKLEKVWNSFRTPNVIIEEAGNCEQMVNNEWIEKQGKIDRVACTCASITKADCYETW